MMRPSPDFDRLLKALRRQEPDRVPLCELLMDREAKEAFLGRPVATLADDVEFWYRAGYDYIGLSPDVTFDHSRGQQIEDGQARPGRRWAVEDSGLILTWDDLAAHPIPSPRDIDYSGLDAVGGLLPEGMGVVGRWGDIFTVAWEMLGFTQFCYAMRENEAFVAHIMNQLGELSLAAYETIVQYDAVGALWYSDDIAYGTGLMVGPDFLRKHLFPWMKRFGDLAHSHGMPFIYHTDGVLWEVMDDLAACGVDALQPIEPAAMDIREVKRRYGDRFALIGNVEVDLLARGTEAQVRAEVRRLLREVAPGGGYLMGSSNTIAYYVRPENYRAMIEETLDSGRYPIDVASEG
ncbi:MAG: uroporphyrinogen decarboxylase family protein [Anaerolineae bacterium]